MKTGDILERDGDRKKFRVFWLGHWSLIRADDGEEYTVKWLGADQWIGTRGPIFHLTAGSSG